MRETEWMTFTGMIRPLVEAQPHDQFYCRRVQRPNGLDKVLLLPRAHFTHSGDPNDTLKRVLRVEVDKVALTEPYQINTSRPVDLPKVGKTTFKIIKHDNELLKMFEMKLLS